MRLPVFVELAGRRVLVVGGGRVAVRRTGRLVASGAEVTVVAPAVHPSLDTDAVRLLRRAFRDDDVDGSWLVLACTDDPDVNAAVATAAEQRQVWCVRADDAAVSAAWWPAVGVVDDVSVAVSAAGDPGRARALLGGIERLLRDGTVHEPRSRAGTGRVTLVGGGPGDPDLLTLRGFRALLDADVVVTDRLGPTGLLDSLPERIEIVDVGKDPRGHAARQEEINDLLVERARAGQRVVRLKGGDPFVLGRGSEEVAACAAAGVGVEVVPGVTSATAAATLAGIPLTERGTTQQFTVVSGHLPPTDPRSTVDWAGIAASDATIVLLMAVANLAPITAALQAGGRLGTTPCAVVENASLPAQRVLTAPLSEVAGRAAAAGVVPPAIVVVGDVVRR